MTALIFYYLFMLSWWYDDNETCFFLLGCVALFFCLFFLQSKELVIAVSIPFLVPIIIKEIIEENRTKKDKQN
jgi:hypothetical protein